MYTTQINVKREFLFVILSYRRLCRYGVKKLLKMLRLRSV